VFDLGSEQRWHITAGYSGPFRYDGTSDPINISFDNLNYTGIVKTDVKFDVFEAGVSYDIARPGPVTISLGTGANIFSFRGSVSGTAIENGGPPTARSSSADALIPVPGLGLGLRWDITDQLYLRGSGRGFYAGNYGNVFDVGAEIGFDFTPNIGIFGGYRWMHAHADVNDVNFDINLRGFYSGLEVRF
jgi:hypothetical protein